VPAIFFLRRISPIANEFFSEGASDFSSHNQPDM